MSNEKIRESTLLTEHVTADVHINGFDASNSGISEVAYSFGTLPSSSTDTSLDHSHESMPDYDSPLTRTSSTRVSNNSAIPYPMFFKRSKKDPGSKQYDALVEELRSVLKERTRLGRSNSIVEDIDKIESNLKDSKKFSKSVDNLNGVFANKALLNHLENHLKGTLSTRFAAANPGPPLPLPPPLAPPNFSKESNNELKTDFTSENPSQELTKTTITVGDDSTVAVNGSNSLNSDVNVSRVRTTDYNSDNYTLLSNSSGVSFSQEDEDDVTYVRSAKRNQVNNSHNLTNGNRINHSGGTSTLERAPSNFTTISVGHSWASDDPDYSTQGHSHDSKTKRKSSLYRSVSQKFQQTVNKITRRDGRRDSNISNHSRSSAIQTHSIDDNFIRRKPRQEANMQRVYNVKFPGKPEVHAESVTLSRASSMMTLPTSPTRSLSPDNMYNMSPQLPYTNIDNHHPKIIFPVPTIGGMTNQSMVLNSDSPSQSLSMSMGSPNQSFPVSQTINHTLSSDFMSLGRHQISSPISHGTPVNSGGASYQMAHTMTRSFNTHNQTNNGFTHTISGSGDHSFLDGRKIVFPVPLVGGGVDSHPITQHLTGTLQGQISGTNPNIPVVMNNLTLQRNNNNGSGSPFVQEIGEGALPSAHGDGLYRGEEDKTAAFIIDSRGFTGEPTVQVDGPNSMAKVSLERQPDGNYSASYIPVEVGLFDVFVKWNGRDIHGSPFHPKIVDARKVRVVGGWQHYMDPQERVQLHVGEEKRIPFDTTDAGPGKLTAEVKGPSGHVHTIIDDNSIGRSVVCFTPKEEGNHYIHLYWSDHPLSNSPFLGYATGGSHDPSKVILTGRGLKEATIREEAEFLIDGSQAGPGSPDVQLTGVRAEVNVIVTPLGGGKFRCTYIPVIPGGYLLHISWNNRRLRGSPYKVNIIGAFYPNRVEVSGEGLRGGMMGDDIDVKIDTRKAGPGELTAYCMGPTHVAFCELHDNHDGRYNLRIKPQETGRHVLQIKYGGEHVLGSPYAFRISAQPDASKVRVSGPGVEHGILATFQSRFIVETRGAGQGQLTVRIRGPKGAFQVEMYRDSQKDRTILCRYDPAETGLYVISIRWSGVDVPGSPFHVNIVDTQHDLENVLQDSAFNSNTMMSRHSGNYSQWRDDI